MQQPKLVLIEWQDSQLGFQGWKEIKEQTIKMPVYLSVGFLIHEDDKCKVLYPHLKLVDDEDDLVGTGDIQIPISAIINITELPYAISPSASSLVQASPVINQTQQPS